ncbi:MAG: serine/threonine-protein kinase [Kofleriaceae bacterium]
MALPREQNIGRYELLIELGRGGMAELFLGRLHAAGGFAKLVAIKRILPHLAQDKQFTELFLNEGQIAARLSHPNVCQVFELDDAGGELFLAMEYLDGVSWDVLIAAAPHAKVLALTAGVLAQASEGLHYAHTLRDLEGHATAIIHRDVSPQNLFVTVDGVCKVLDFGVAKLMTDGPRTRSGVVKGKLPYMAPEQIRGEDVDARTDVFSLGVCAWEALANERLFDRTTDFQIWKAITEQDAPAIASRWPQCPAAVDAVIRRALERDAANRFESARAFAEALRLAVPDALGPPAIAELVRSACGDKIAARAKQVASAVSTRRSVPPSDAGASAAQTIDIERSAAETLDEKHRLAPAPGDTTDLRMRDRSIVLERAGSSELVPPRSRAGLVIGGVAALAVIGVLIFAMTRTPASRPVAADAAVVAVAPPIAMDAIERPAILEADAATPIDAPPPPKPTPRPKAPKPAGEPGSFSVGSEPYATIFVDGQRIGETPLFQAPLPAGRHRVRAVLADGRERTFTIDVPPGKELSSGRLAW